MTRQAHRRPGHLCVRTNVRRYNTPARRRRAGWVHLLNTGPPERTPKTRSSVFNGLRAVSQPINRYRRLFLACFSPVVLLFSACFRRRAAQQRRGRTGGLPRHEQDGRKSFTMTKSGRLAPPRNDMSKMSWTQFRSGCAGASVASRSLRSLLVRSDQPEPPSPSPRSRTCARSFMATVALHGAVHWQRPDHQDIG